MHIFDLHIIIIYLYDLLVCDLSFILITVSFEEQKISVFMNQIDPFFSFIDHAFSVVSMTWV